MLYSRSLGGQNGLTEQSVSCNISCMLLVCGVLLVEMVIWLFVAAREHSWRQIKGVVGIRVYLPSAQRRKLSVFVYVCVNFCYLLNEEQQEVQSCGGA